MSRNISFSISRDYGWQQCAQIQASWTAVLLITGSLWIHEYDIQSFVFYIVRNLYSWSIVEIQCHHLKLWWSILIIHRATTLYIYIHIWSNPGLQRDLSTLAIRCIKFGVSEESIIFKWVCSLKDDLTCFKLIIMLFF